jgi:large subunit ribosomal protein L17
MRHRMLGRRLGRNTAQRKALRRNMVADLIAHEQVITTEAKARMLRPVAEKIITLAKRGLAKGPEGGVHARRLAAARLHRFRQTDDEDGATQDIDVVRKLFDEIAPRYADRPGGYTRMVKMGRRPGDNAEMAVVTLVND